MPSLSEILNSKAESKQQRTESRRAEREQLSQMRDGALSGRAFPEQCHARQFDGCAGRLALEKT